MSVTDVPHEPAAPLPSADESGAHGVGSGRPDSPDLRVEATVCPAQVRPSWAGSAWLLCLVAMVLCFAFRPDGVPQWLLVLATFLTFVATSCAVLWMYRREGQRVRCVARVKGRALLLGDMPPVMIGEFLLGTMSEAPGQPPKLTLVRQRGISIELEVATTEDGRRLLKALGLGLSHFVADGAAFPFFLLVLWSLLALLPQFFLETRSSIVVSGIMVLSALLLLRLVQRVYVGADGVAVYGLRMSRFVSFAEIVALTSRQGIAPRFGMELRDGGHLRVFLKSTKALAELLAAVDNARSAYRADLATDTIGALHRHGRSVATWVTELRRVGSGAQQDHRTAPAEGERLLRIATSANEGPSKRAAAAIALSSTDDPRDRERLLELSRTTARPKLRVLLQHASAGASDEVLAAALESVAEEEEEETGTHAKI